MKEYLMGLFALGICCAVVEMLAPEGEGGGIARHIRLLSVVSLLCVVVSPVVALLQREDSLPEYGKALLDGWGESAEQVREDLEERFYLETERLDMALAEQTVAELLQERFSLSSEDCRVVLTVDEQSNVIGMRVALRGQGIWVNTHELTEYIKQTFGCECIIYIE